MKITPKFIQRNCIEGDKIDLRQANAVLEHKPDIILFEFPAEKSGPSTIFNKYPVDKKPLKKVAEIIKNLKIAAQKYPYAESDIAIWENIKKLWKQNHNIYIYKIDSPSELRRGYFENFEIKYPQTRKDWLFWVYLYLREAYMTKNIQSILKNYKEKEKPTIAVFLQSIHWEHVKFLLKKPSESEIFKYYFGRFSTLKKKTMDKEIKNENPFLYKWWKILNYN
jgi:hypothetical protein